MRRRRTAEMNARLCTARSTFTRLRGSLHTYVPRSYACTYVTQYHTVPSSTPRLHKLSVGRRYRTLPLPHRYRRERRQSMVIDYLFVTLPSTPTTSGRFEGDRR